MHKNIKKYLLRFSFYAMILFLLNLGVGEILKSKKRVQIKENNFFPAMRWKEFYQAPDNTLDIIFIGSSHCYRTFDTEIIDSICSLNSFNMGSSFQTPLTSYFVLKEVLKTQKPKFVVFENYFDMLFSTNQLINSSYNMDHMKNNINKLEFYAYGLNYSEKLKYFLTSYRYRNNIDYLFTIEKEINSKDIYKSKGYVENDSIIDIINIQEKNLFNNYYFNEKLINQKQLNAVTNLTDLCKSQEINIIWAMAPIPHISYKKIKNPEDIDSFYDNLSQENKVHFHNYQNSFIINFSDSLDFSDDNHLNINGARKISIDIAKKINQQIIKEKSED